MGRQHVRSIEGLPEPSDIFQPHMPGVELFSDMGALFDAARTLSATGELPAAESAAEVEKLKGWRSVVVVTPGRSFMPAPAPAPGGAPRDAVENIRRILPPDPPLAVTVVAYTHARALAEDKSKAIPFLGFLVGFASVGHTVVVFEGHPSAFESGVRGSDVLLIDSGMLPFVQKDWKEAAFRVMRPGAKVLVHERETYKLVRHLAPGAATAPPVLSPDERVDWYAGSLVRLILSGTRNSAQLTSGETLPDLADFATTPEMRAQIAALPFRHDELDADEVIDSILMTAGWRPFKRRGTLRIPVETVEGPRLGACGVELSKGPGGRRRLLLER